MNLRRVVTALTVLMLLAGIVCAEEQAPAPCTGILSAFGDEVTLLEQELADAQSQTIQGIRFVAGKLRGRSVVIASSGVGKVHAAMTVTLLIDHFKPSEVLFTGIAGAVSPDLHPGDIVIGEKTAQHDLGSLTPEGLSRRGVRNPVDWVAGPVVLAADPKLCALAEAAAQGVKLGEIATSEGLRRPKVVRGIIVTGDVFVASPTKKEELRRELNADAVEMEGAAVAQVCYVLRVPWLVIRSISDAADANASRDVSRFYPIAAQNSTHLVTEIVARLAGP